MSFSTNKPFFGTKQGRTRPNVPTTDPAEHWSVLIARRPDLQKYGKGWQGGSIEVDFDNRLDNWDDPEGEQ